MNTARDERLTLCELTASRNDRHTAHARQIVTDLMFRHRDCCGYQGGSRAREYGQIVYETGQHVVNGIFKKRSFAGR